MSATSRPLLGGALVAHLARHPHSFKDPGREGAGADRARGANIVGAVADRAPAEVVALDPALKALADRDSGDLHLLARLESGDRHVVPDLDRVVVAFAEGLVAELDQMAGRGGAGLLQVAFLRLAQLALLDLAEGELHGDVAVLLLVADRRHLAGAGLDHGDRQDRSVLAEDLGHAELLAEDRGHRPYSRISMSTPAGSESSRCSESTVFGEG